jgi:murein DD-endopeptidase MepM/ murein hydrolase activator NlpD
MNRILTTVGLTLFVGLVSYLPQAAAQPEPPKPFILPFQEPPGPDTWLLAQTYGNTTGAYRQRDTTYSASQGIHFGIDFSARCGTELVAIADGVIYATDALSFGSAPHNLLIDHPELGYTSLYGHLLERPQLQPGQPVKAGDVVALSGDPAETCYGRPHLHLEIRDMRNRARKFNPVLLMQADWDNLALVGPFSRSFQRDLDDPRKWQHLDDQPEAVSGGPLLNDFANPWPPDLR